MKMKKVLNNAAAQTQKLSLIMRRKESITEKQMWDLSSRQILVVLNLSRFGFN